MWMLNMQVLLNNFLEKNADSSKVMQYALDWDFNKNSMQNCC